MLVTVPVCSESFRFHLTKNTNFRKHAENNLFYYLFTIQVFILSQLLIPLRTIQGFLNILVTRL